MRSLERILQAYALHNPSIGYCQSMNFICGFLLLHLNEEESFWMLLHMIENIISAEYYTDNLLGAYADQHVFLHIIEKYLPEIYQVLCKSGLDEQLPLIGIKWFMCLFIDTLPFFIVQRIWDLFLNEGMTVIFKIAAAMLKYFEKEILSADTVELYNLISSLGSRIIDPNKLFQLAFGSKNNKINILAPVTKKSTENVRLTATNLNRIPQTLQGIGVAHSGPLDPLASLRFQQIGRVDSLRTQTGSVDKKLFTFLFRKQLEDELRNKKEEESNVDLGEVLASLRFTNDSRTSEASQNHALVAGKLTAEDPTTEVSANVVHSSLHALHPQQADVDDNEDVEPGEEEEEEEEAEPSIGNKLLGKELTSAEIQRIRKTCGTTIPFEERRQKSLNKEEQQIIRRKQLESKNTLFPFTDEDLIRWRDFVIPSVREEYSNFNQARMTLAGEHQDLLLLEPNVEDFIHSSCTRLSITLRKSISSYDRHL